MSEERIGGIMTGKFTFTAKTYPKCDDYLRIRWNGEEYKKLEDFIKTHVSATESELDACMIQYRGVEKTYKEFIDDYATYADGMKFIEFCPFKLIMNQSIKASLYFMEKTLDCMQTARFFAMKSKLILDTDFNMHWSQGYIPQYLFRCTYFGTAATWYSNTFDQLLQSVYWAYKLYTSASDRDGNTYTNEWDVKKIMTFCTYEFVVGELKKRGQTDVRKLLTACSGKIEEVRLWANYIKHKGGVDYKDSQAEDPFKIYIMPVGTTPESDKPDERFLIENFKSPVEIDIDEKSEVMSNVHSALYDCITKVIETIDYDSYKLQFGGTN